MVTSQCHMQIERRHGLPGVRQPIESRERGPGGRRRRETKARARGAQGVSVAGESPRPTPVGTHLGAGGGRHGVEVVVRRGVSGSPAAHRPGRIAGARGGSRGRRRGRSLRAAELARRALSLCRRCGGAHGTNWNVQTADCDVTKRPARLASPASGAAANPGLRIPPPSCPSPPGLRAGRSGRETFSEPGG